MAAQFIERDDELCSPELEESSVSSTGSPVAIDAVKTMEAASVEIVPPLYFAMSSLPVNGNSAVAVQVVYDVNPKIVELNNYGVLFYDKGDLGSSEVCFVQGLSLLSHPQFFNAQQLANPSAAAAMFSAENNSVLGSASSASAASTSVGADSSFSPAWSESPSISNDLDEGLTNVYKQAELLSLEYGDFQHASPGTSAMIEATLLFNMAQVKHRLTPFSDEAMMLYQQVTQAVHTASLLNAASPPLALDTAFYMGLPLQSSTNFAAINLIHSHQILLPSLFHVGVGFFRRQKYNEAAAYFKLVFDQSLALYGNKSFGVGVALQALGVVQYHRMVPVPQSSQSSPSKPDTATAMPNLSQSTEITFSALQYFLEALQVWQACLAPTDPMVATTFHNVARVLLAQKQYQQATVYLERALQLRLDRFGAEHADSAWTTYLMGMALANMNDPDRALPFYRKFVKHQSPSFTKARRDVAFSLSSSAQSYEQRKDFTTAREIYEESLTVGRKALGYRNPEMALLLNRAGNFYFDRERFDEALKIYREGLAVERAVLSPTHPNVVVTYFNIGEIHKKKGNHARAIKLYTRATQLQRINFGDCCAEVASSLNAIGWLYEQNGQSMVALKYLQEALVMRRTVLGDNHLDLASSLTDVGTLFCRNNMFHDALAVLTESLRIRTEQLGPDHRDVSFTMYNIALCHQAQGNYKEAHACFRETLRVEEHVLGKSHKDVALTLFKLGEVLKVSGDLEEALDCFRQALDIDKVLFADEPVILAKTLNEIGNIHVIRGDTKRMMDAFIEAARLYRRAGRPLSSPLLSPSLRLYDARYDATAPAA